jgi:hypothetical protein
VRQTMKRWSFIAGFCALLAAGSAFAAQRFHEEPDDSGWAFYVDNDLLAGTGTDRDYTGGFSLTFSGRRARRTPLSLDAWRAGLDRLVGVDRFYADREFSRHSLETGLTVFTPGHLSDPAEQIGDRPYASLIYLANTGVEVAPARGVAYLSTLTLGVIGAPFVADLQRDLHRAFGDTEPVGWQNQISDGGEPTFRYAFARVRRAWSGRLGDTDGEMTTTWRGSVGYLTELSFGVASRFGKIRTPWWSYNPQIAEYAEKSVPVVESEGGGTERYWWTGFNIRARAYNVFLQGQFRDSPVTFAPDALRPVVLEAWLGYTWALADGWRFSYVLRGQSSEIRNGPGDRVLRWGGVIVSYAR